MGQYQLSQTGKGYIEKIGDCIPGSDKNRGYDREKRYIMSVSHVIEPEPIEYISGILWIIVQVKRMIFKY